MALRSALSARCVASAWTIWPSVARRTCGEFFPPMRDIIIKRARTWLYRKMHRNNGLSNSLAGSPLFPSWPVYISDTSGYDFRKGLASVSEENMLDVRDRRPHLCEKQSIIRFPEPSAHFSTHVHLDQRELLDVLRVDLVEVGG